MVNWITKLLRKHEQKRLLTAIIQEHPEFVNGEGDETIYRYILQELEVFTLQQTVCQEAGPGDAQEPSIPPLLLRCLRYWTVRPALIYAIGHLQAELEKARLLEKQAILVQIIQEYQQHTKIVVEIAQDATNLASQVNESVKPEFRLN
ncbi:hypothetical protein [Spirosoma endophyticum]|uniref:Uncharacterized protein n=1 Tax=Spirosoma endophyticum TaxID=662367 RepID=A0A1I2I4E5_9BACT|nr:hypothetical protein [Spirosoma endophyticum]SFF36490.1 hypothetical protein SAMN05216167_15514 [Spirosoma endophyticum]